MANGFLPDQLNRPPEKKLPEGFEKFLLDKISQFDGQDEEVFPASDAVTAPEPAGLFTPRGQERLAAAQVFEKKESLKKQLHSTEGIEYEAFFKLTEKEQGELFGPFESASEGMHGNKVVMRAQDITEGESFLGAIDKRALAVANAPITVGPVTMKAGEWAGLLGITIATGGAILAGLPLAYNVLFNGAFQRNINKWSIDTGKPVDPKLVKAAADYFSRQMKPTFANAARAIKEMFRPSATGKFVPTADATAKADAYAKGIVTRVMPEFSKTRTDLVIQGLQSGKYQDIISPTAQAVQGAAGQVPTVEIVSNKMVAGEQLSLEEQQFRINNSQEIEGILKARAGEPTTPPSAQAVQGVVGQLDPEVTPTLADIPLPNPLFTNKAAVDAMTKGYIEGNPAILNRPIAVRRTKDGFVIIEGHNRIAAAKAAGVEPPIVVLTEKQVEGLNAPEVDALAKKVFNQLPEQPTPTPQVTPTPPKGVELYHGTMAEFPSTDIVGGKRMFGIHLTTDESVAKTYAGKVGSVKKYSLSSDAKVLDLSDGDSLWAFMKKEGILDADDIANIDLENYVRDGRLFQYDISSKTSLADDVAKTAKEKGYDVVRMADDLGVEDNVAYVVVNKEKLIIPEVAPTPPTRVEGEVVPTEGIQEAENVIAGRPIFTSPAQKAATDGETIYINTGAKFQTEAEIDKFFVDYKGTIVAKDLERARRIIANTREGVIAHEQGHAFSDSIRQTPLEANLSTEIRKISIAEETAVRARQPIGRPPLLSTGLTRGENLNVASEEIPQQYALYKTSPELQKKYFPEIYKLFNENKSLVTDFALPVKTVATTPTAPETAVTPTGARWRDAEGEGAPTEIAAIPGESLEIYGNNEAHLTFTEGEPTQYYIQRADGTFVLNPKTQNALFETPEAAKSEFAKQVQSSPVIVTQQVESIQQQGKVAPRTVPPEDAKFSHIEKASPDGPRPPKPPKPVKGATPEKQPSEILQELVDSQLEGKSLTETATRLYGGASRRVKTQTAATVEEISNELHAKPLGIGIKKRGFIVPREKDKPILDELYDALHNPSKVASGEIAIPKGFESVYEKLRGLADWDTASRLDADPNAMTLVDWFFRGWKPPEGMFPASGKGQLGAQPSALKKPRVGATYREMRELGFEPLYWNPAQQWGYRHNLGEIYREQMVLVDQLKSLDDNLIMPVVGGSLPSGWRVPEIGPAFEGKPFATIDADGNPAVMFARRWAVPNTTANLLESMFGKRLDLGTLNVFGKDIDPLIIIDLIAFVPKRAKLILSYFQHLDFLNRTGGNSWAKVLDSIAAGKPIDAAIAAVRFPKDAFDIVKANFSPSTRLSLAKQWEDTTPLLEGRPGVHNQGIFKAGISVMDETIFAKDMDKLMRSAADNTGVWDKLKGVGSSIVDFESSMRRGLFGGTYPAAMMTSIKNYFAPMMARQHPKATDQQLCGYIAEAVNLRFSTLPVEQSILQNRVIREFVRRVAFSWGESEALVRQATRMFHGSDKRFWIKNFAGTLLFLAVVANIVHYASTGEPLPLERYVPISKHKWGPLPFGYNTRFLSPTLPIKGRGGVELTVDLMGQMDTIFRVLNPIFFTTSRVSVPIRGVANQVSGTDFYGAPVEGFGQRAGLFATDFFAPIGVGGLLVEGARQFIPGAEGVLLEGESRLGLSGLALQATGANIRAENTREVLDRKAKESGLLKRDGTPVQDWNELEPYQKDKLMEDKALIAELALRQETSVARGAEGAEGFAIKEALAQERITRGEALVTEFERGRFQDTSEFPKEVTKLKADIASRRSQVDEDFQLFEDTDELPQDPNTRALVEYYSIFDKATSESGAIDWELVEQWEAAYRVYWTDEQEAYVEDNSGITEWGPKMQEYIDAQKVLSDSGYWDLNEPDLYEKRQALRLQNPEIDAILQKWYKYKPITPPRPVIRQSGGTDPFGRDKTSRTDPFGRTRDSSRKPVFK